MKRSLLIILCILISSMCVNAQTDTSILRKKLKFPYWGYVKYMNQEHNNIFNGFCYSRTMFVGNQALRSVWETKFSFGITIYPCILDANITKGPMRKNQGDKLSLEKISFSLSFHLPILHYLERLFLINLLSDNILTYIGFGWQDIELRKSSYSSDNIDFNTFILRLGCSYSFNKIPIVGMIEYERSISGSKKKQYHAFSIGVVVEWQVLKALLKTGHKYIPCNIY